MVGDIREHLAKIPFQAFTIHMADGRHIRVPSVDHVNLIGTRVTVNHDDGDIDVLPGLLMAGLTIHASAAVDAGDDQ